MDLNSVSFFILSFIVATVDMVEGNAGIQYRISAESFNKVAKVLTSQHSGYFVYSDDNQKKGILGNLMYTLTNFKLKEVHLDDVSTNITQNNCLKAKATLSTMELTGEVLLKREQSKDPIYQGTTDVVFNNVTFISTGKVEYVGMAGQTVMTMPNCSVMAEEIKLEDEFVQASGTYVPSSEVHEMFEDLVCSVYKLQFSLGFTKTMLDLNLNLIQLKMSFYPAHLAIENNTLLLMYLVDLRSSDSGFPVETKPYSLPQFPPVQETASPFELWLNSDVFNDFLDDFLRELEIRFGRKIRLTDILPITDYQKLINYLHYIHQIPTTFPNSTIDLYVTDGDISLEVMPQQVLINLNADVELIVTLNCDRNRTYSAVKFLVNVFIPAQFGYNQGNLTLRYVLFGGNITVLETKIGKVADGFLSNFFHILPQYLTSSVFDGVNGKIKGQPFSDYIPPGTYLQNIKVTLDQDYLVIHGDLTDQAPAETENDTESKWIPEYSIRYLNNLMFPLIEETPENQTPIPVQNCDIVSSSAKGTNNQHTYLASLLFFVPVLLG